MAGSVVQALGVTNGGSGSTNIWTPATNLGSGNLLVLFFYNRTINTVLSSVSGTGVTSWTQQISLTEGQGNGGTFGLWTCPVGGASGTKPAITATQAGSSWFGSIWAELTGVDTSSTPLDHSATATGSNNNFPSAGPTAAATATELGLAFCAIDGGNAVTADTGAGFAEVVSDTNSLPRDLGSITVTSGNTFTASTHAPTQGPFMEIAALFKNASGGAAFIALAPKIISQAIARSAYR